MTSRFLTVTLPICATMLTGIVVLTHAGPLEPPPGPIQPTGPTRLGAQLAPPLTIDTPGSYLLTGNLTGVSDEHGIVIAADHVTLDLGGFALLGVPGSLDGITTTGARRAIVVRNGAVADWGEDGIDLSTAAATELTDLRLTGNGANGLHTGDDATITQCTSRGNGNIGIVVGSGSVAVDCTANSNASHGLRVDFQAATISRCTTRANGGTGLSSGFNCTITACTATGNTLDGIRASTGSTVQQCIANGNSQDGIEAVAGTLIRDNVCQGNGDGTDGGGIHAPFDNSRIEGNHLVNNTRGLDVDGIRNYIADNIVRTNDDNYDIAQGNHLNLLISEIPESIDWPASVRLAGTLFGGPSTDALTINTDNATIDLNGHALLGAAGTTAVDAIDAETRANTLVRNGAITDWGGRALVAGPGARAENLRVSGVGTHGIEFDDASVVTHCSVRNATDTGIRTSGVASSIIGCTAMSAEWGIIASGLCALSATFDCDFGIDGNAAVVTGCSSVSNSTIGISGTSCVVHACRSGGGLSGIVGHQGVVTNCLVHQATDDGLLATDALIRGNNVVQDIGNPIFGDGSLVIENHTD